MLAHRQRPASQACCKEYEASVAHIAITSRFGHAAIVVGLVLSCLFLTDQLLRFFLGAQSGPLKQAAFVDMDVLRDHAARIVAVERQLRAEGTGARPLAVVVGLSTAREGIDGRLFGEATADRFRVLNLASSGGSFGEMQAYTEPFLAASLRPDLVLVTAHASWLAGRVSRASLKPALMPAEFTVPRLREHARVWGKWLEQYSWLLVNRTAVQAELRHAQLAARGHIESWLGRPLDVRNDPWAGRERYADQHASADFLAMQLMEWGASGWFDSARMGTDAAEAGILRVLLSKLQMKSSNVVLVLMPEADAFRDRVPERGVQTLNALARQAHPPIPILDLRDTMPAYAFRDQAHLNFEGRRLFTELLAKCLATLRRDLSQ